MKKLSKLHEWVLDLIIRESFPLLPEWTPPVMYLVLIPFTLIFIWGLIRILSKFGIWDALRELSVGKLVRGLARTFSQRRVIRKLRGYSHALLFFGVFVLLLGTLTVFLETDILQHLGIRILVDASYLAFEAIMDIFGILLIVGALTFLPTREREGKLLSLGLLYIGVTGFLLESTRIYAHPYEGASYSFIGYYMSNIVGPSILPIYTPLWWSHALLAFAMVAFLPYTNLLHSVIAIMTLSLQEEYASFPKEPFTLEELEEMEEEIHLGFESPQEIPWYERYMLAACVKCGRCTDSCPANIIGRPLSPKDVVNGLKSSILGSEYRLEDEAVWSCVSCGACFSSCPNYISPFTFLMERRRFLVAEGRIDKKMGELLNSLRRYKNALSVPQRGRLNWLESDEEPDYYLWVGCQYSFDPVGKKVVSKLVGLLRGAGLKIATLGEMETCCGEPARRLGEEGMFQEFALTNAELFKELGVKKLIVLCPHGLTVFRNEYKRVIKDFDVEIISHVELLAKLVREGKLKVKSVEGLTFHDPCNLARFNGIVEEPRVILRKAGFVEMKRHGIDTFCCGAGGANYWYQVGEGTMSKERVKEALSMGISKMVVACPFCYAMLNDAAKGMNLEKFEVLELTELLDL